MDLGTVVDHVARWYAARSWWAELDDLKQEAWVAVLEAQQTYDPEHPSGRTLAQYAKQAAVYRLKDFMWAQSAPVVGRKHHGDTLRGIHRASVHALYDHAAPDPMELAEVERWWAALSEAVRQLVRSGHDGEVAARVLLSRERPTAIAEDIQWPIHRVWRASSRARKRIKNDLGLRHGMMQGA